MDRHQIVCPSNKNPKYYMMTLFDIRYHQIAYLCCKSRKLNIKKDHQILYLKGQEKQANLFIIDIY